MSPGGSRPYLFLRYLDYLRGECPLLKEDSYFRHCVQVDYFSPSCELHLSSVSSGTLKVLLGHLEAALASRSLGGFDPKSDGFSKNDILKMVSDAVEMIETTVNLRNQAIDQSSRDDLIALVARAILLRSFWREVLVPAYEMAFPGGEGIDKHSKGHLRFSDDIESKQAEGRVLMMIEGYKWLKHNGFNSKLYDDLDGGGEVSSLR